MVDEGCWTADIDAKDIDIFQSVDLNDTVWQKKGKSVTVCQPINSYWYVLTVTKDLSVYHRLFRI